VSVGYRAVGWNHTKRVYDGLLVGGILAYLAVFTVLMLVFHPAVTLETALLRAAGSGALVLLHVILSIGPLCRLDTRFLPLLYNRRHMGVALFLLATAHGALALIQYHALGDLNPIVSVLVSETRWDSLAHLPFQPFGLAALAILFMMAATSHDFWLANLTPPVWKALHMLVYVAWALVFLHVIFGVLQDERGDGLALLLLLGLVWVGGLHLWAGWVETREDRAGVRWVGGDLVDACAADSIPEGRALVVTIGGERVAVFRWEGQVVALSNVCQHQNGPLGEGRVIDGCVTCPWHGYQYRPEDGASPPPFSESVPTFRVELREGRVLIDPRPCPPGTPQTPAVCEPSDDA
jgi:nitrite reductase/ring-hydroxylating ferredoxin subunit/DMSO/TMAO reductase YedYZ heme-binding membrane subunit